MRILTYIITILLTAIPSIYCMDGRTVNTQSVDITTQADPYFGIITLHATSDEKSRITKLTIKSPILDIDIPQKGLQDLNAIQISNIYLDVILFDPQKPYLQITFGSYQKAINCLARVTFTIEDTKTIHRAITWDNKEGKTINECMKL